jgi:hypothetical protein
MSEYQYYGFAAIDRPLSVEEQADLRVISTRAQITPTSFVNHYEWGDLKAAKNLTFAVAGEPRCTGPGWPSKTPV